MKDSPDGDRIDMVGVVNPKRKSANQITPDVFPQGSPCTRVRADGQNSLVDCSDEIFRKSRVNLPIELDGLDKIPLGIGMKTVADHCRLNFRA